MTRRWRALAAIGLGVLATTPLLAQESNEELAKKLSNPVATDPDARQRFLRYWRWARFGIVLIRWLMLPAIRRQAEAEFNTRLQGSKG